MPQLVGKEVGPIGFGMMGLTWKKVPPSQEQAFETLRTALKNGNTAWNGAEFYGPPEYNSLVLIERYLEKYPEDANKMVLNVKGGVNPVTHRFDGSAENTRRSIDACLDQLKGRTKLNIFTIARRDPNVPLEVTLGVIDKEYVQTGKIDGVALSEVRAETIHEAVKHTKIVAVEVELSLFSPDILENGVAAACAEHDIPIIAYSPIGRGVLTGKLTKSTDVPADAIISHFPRFQPENFEANLELVAQVRRIAAAKPSSCTPAQLALGWVLALAKRPGMPKTIIPIPGASTAAHAEENNVLVELTDDDMANIDTILAGFTTAGERYPEDVPMNG